MPIISGVGSRKDRNLIKLVPDSCIHTACPMATHPNGFDYIIVEEKS